MKRQLVILLLTVIAVLCCALCFAACGDKNGNAQASGGQRQRVDGLRILYR